MDGLDVAVGDFAWDGDAVVLTPLHHDERPWPDDLRRRLRAVLPPAGTTVDELARLDTLVGQAAAESRRGHRCRADRQPRADGLPLDRGRARARARCRSASPPGSSRRPGCPWCPTCGRATSRRAGRARRWPARWTRCGCRAARRRSTSAASPTSRSSSDGGVRSVLRHRPGQLPARPRRARRHGRPSWTTTATARSPRAGTVDVDAARAAARRPLLRAAGRRSRPAASASTPATSTASSPVPTCSPRSPS